MGLKTLIKDSTYGTLGYLARRRLSVDHVILMYHSVGADHQLGPLDISLDAFQNHLSILKSEFDVVPIAEIMDVKREKPVAAITFDDGYAHLYPEVAELLASYEMPATFYLPTGLIGETISTSYGDSYVMGWDVLQELVRTGFTVGSHSLTHQRLTSLDAESARAEIVESRRLLEERLGIVVEDFSYPAGKYNREIVRLVDEAGYRRAVTVHEAPLDVRENPFTLPRIGLFASTTASQFRAKLAGAGYYYNQAKGLFHEGRRPFDKLRTGSHHQA